MIALDSVKVHPSGPLRGDITVPSDKSITHRAVLFSGLADGRSVVRNPLRGEDCLRTVAALRSMGIEIEDRGAEFIVSGRGLGGLREPEDVVDCGNSGTTARLLCGLLAAQEGFFSVLTGDASLRRRPMKRVTEPLSAMGGRFHGRQGGRLLPLSVEGGKLRPLVYDSPVSSAQVKTAILLAGLFTDGETEVREPEKSRDHTERMFRGMGVEIAEQANSVRLKGRQALRPLDMTVPGDLSSAAFFIVAATLIPGSEVLIRSVGVNPTRTGILDILRAMGADIVISQERLEGGEPVADIRVRSATLRGIPIRGELVVRAIDEFPILCVAAALAEGTTEIRDASELRVKESDRIATMASGLRAMGAEVEELPDGMVIRGSERLSSGTFPSLGDHRIAMSMSVAALRASGISTVTGAECIATSFPGFFDILGRLQKGS